MNSESDHDILLELRGDVKSLLNISPDHEMRLRFLERWAWMAIGAIGIIDVMLGLIIIYYHG